METCKYGSGAGKRKPTAVKWKGVVCRAYKLQKRNSIRIWKTYLHDWEISKSMLLMLYRRRLL